MLDTYSHDGINSEEYMFTEIEGCSIEMEGLGVDFEAEVAEIDAQQLAAAVVLNDEHWDESLNEVFPGDVDGKYAKRFEAQIQEARAAVADLMRGVEPDPVTFSNTGFYRGKSYDRNALRG